MLPEDDIRYPWALAALSQSEAAVLDVLAGKIPVFVDQGMQWTASYLPAGENDANEQAWELVDIFDDSVQACTTACAYLLANSETDSVRVSSETGVRIFVLSRNITLATS
jgi:hypothetical protein